ncbi:MAG: YicC family protein [Verrucomicrobia bacterium]|nr:YicC family protein [Verrucomicrobiota bacterium]
MKSMTGHGRGEASQDGFKIAVEVSSVNRKQSEISVNLPDELEPLEAQVRDEINRVISRGRLSVRVSMHAADTAHAKARVNVAVAKAYAKELRAVAKELKISADLTLDTLLRAPGVLESAAELDDAEAFWPAVKKALDAALANLVKMRSREGKHLADDLRARLGSVRAAVAEVQRQAPQVAANYREALLTRIRNAGLEGIAPDDERLLKEVTLFADRTDISEELTRLESHFKQYDDLLKSSEPVGRTFDFLMQELNREINTVGSKANDALIARHVVAVKAEFEKIREQVQNIE